MNLTFNTYIYIYVGELSLHLWDIHIEEEYQRKGLGKHVLLILELIARQQKMQVLSVPVQLMDDRTLSWISKVKGFAPDTKLHDLLKFDPEMEGFEVYAKYFSAPKPMTQSSPTAATMSTQYSSSPVAKNGDTSTVDPLTPSQSTLNDLSRSTANVKKSIDFLLASQSQSQTQKDEELKPSASIIDTTSDHSNGTHKAAALTEDEIVALQETLQDLQGLYFQKHGREPTEDEMSQWIDVLSGPDGLEHQRLQQSLQSIESTGTTEDSDSDYDKLEDIKTMSLNDASK